MDRIVPRMALSLLLSALTTSSSLAQSVSVDAAPSSAPAAASANDPWSTPDIEPHVAPRVVSRRHADPAAAREGVAPAFPQGSWVRTTAALAGVVGLIVLLGWGYRGMLGSGSRRWATRGRHPSLLEVVSRTALSPRQSLCLVRCGPRLVLLGVTADAIRPLDVINDADLTARLMGDVARQRPDSSTAEFARCLESEARGYSDDRQEPDAPRTTDDRQLGAVRNRLAETLGRLRSKGGGAQ